MGHEMQSWIISLVLCQGQRSCKPDLQQRRWCGSDPGVPPVEGARAYSWVCENFSASFWEAFCDVFVNEKKNSQERPQRFGMFW